MARNFGEADFTIWVDSKIIGGKNSTGKQQGFVISDSDWTSTVLPAINGTFHVAGVDELTCLHYWKENNPVGEAVWYLAENKDLSGEVAITTNDSTKVNEATTLVNTLTPLRTTYETAYNAEQQAALDAENQRKYFVDNQIPENLLALRAMRDQLMQDTDFYMLEDIWEHYAADPPAQVPAAARVKDNWKTYRKRLRDLPSQQADPYDYNNFTGWPVPPTDATFVP
mgnify:FL=1|tara:strand:- start:10185 stop:10862 length:678 start_codon:yes stop_codon:yes gene_type:complete